MPVFAELQGLLRDALQGLTHTVADSRRGIRDVLVLIVPQVATVIAAFVTSILIARGLGPAGVGQYALILSLAGVAASLSDLGIGQTAIRFASRAISVGDTDGQYAVMRWAFRLRLLLSVTVTALLVVLVPMIAELWKASDLIGIMRIGLIGGIFTAMASIPSVYFQSLKQFGRNATIIVVQTLVTLVGIILLAALGWWSVERAVIVTLIATAVGAVIFLVAIPRRALVGRNPLPPTVRDGLRKIWQNPLAGASKGTGHDIDSPTSFALYNLASTVIVLIILRLDIWLIGAFLTQGEVGVYNIASRFSTPLSILLTAIGGALWPRASSSMGLEQIRHLMVKTFRLCALLAVGSAVYALLMPALAPFLFGLEFQESVLLGQLLCLRYAFAILIAPIGIIGYSLGMVRVYWKINLVQLIGVVLVNILFLPAWGPVASAVALLVNEFIGVALAGSILHKRFTALGEPGHA